MPDARVACVALGSNIGDRSAHLAAARCAVSLLAGCRLIAASAVEETAPFGDVAQGPYLNQMIAVETTLTGAALLGALQRIELHLGRVRDRRWGPRTIDLDIVTLGDERISSPTLVVPHEGIAARDFWRREIESLSRQLRGAA